MVPSFPSDPFATAGPALLGQRLRRELADLPDWRPARAQTTVRLVGAPPDALSALWLATALLNHPAKELLRELVFRPGWVQVEIGEPARGGVSPRCLELAAEISSLLTRLAVERRSTQAAGRRGRPALRRPKLEPSASGPEETG